MGLARSARLLPVAAATWAVAGAAVVWPDAAAVLAASLWIGALAGLAVLVRGARPRASRVVALTALALAAASASHVAFTEPERDRVRSLSIEGGRAVEIEATVTGKVESRAKGMIAFDAVAHAIRIGARSESTDIPVLIRSDPGDVVPADGLDVGARIVARGTAGEGGAADRAVLVVTARGVSVDRPAEGILALTSGLRRGLVTAADGLPQPGAGLIPGLAVGETSAVGAELDAAMKASSLSHLTAVSGANCALVVGLAFMLCAGIGAPRGVRVAAGAVVLGAFVILVTPEPSVVRAASMAAIAMIALLLGRAGAGASVLSIAVAAALVADPWLAGSLGFALSATATASLLILSRPLASGLARVMPRALALALAVPVAAQLACGPLLILVDPVVPLYGVVANLLAAPAAPIATVLGLLACLALPLPPLAALLAALAWLPAAWIAATAGVVSDLPGNRLPWLEGIPGAIALAFVGAAIALVIGARRAGRGGRARAVAAGLLAVLTGVAGGGAALSGWGGGSALPPRWSILMCDVGQGDAVLVRTADAVALIDTGPDPDLLRSCLVDAGVARIDLLVLTHFDSDHVGAASVLDGRVGTIIHGPADPGGARVIDALTTSGARALPVSAGATGALGDARWRVLWPPVDETTPGNDASVVLEISDGGIPSSLFLGDLSAEAQRSLLRHSAVGTDYPVVKVAHHGSADQHAGLYERTRPSIALIPVGASNDYGHPRAELLDILAASGAAVARTDLHGAAAVWADGDDLRLWRERAGVDLDR